MATQWQRSDMTRKQRAVMESLADGASQPAAAREAGVSVAYVRKLLYHPRYAAWQEMLDEMTLATGIAREAERIRIVKRVVRQALEDDRVLTQKDVLDWLRFAREDLEKSVVTVRIEDVEQLADSVVDSLNRNIHDPALLAAVLSDLGLVNGE